MESPTEPATPSSRRNRIHPLGVVVLGVIIFASILVIFRDRTPPLTRETFQANRERWLRSGVSSYDFTMTVDLPDQDKKVYEIEVRSGQVVSMKIDGTPSKRGDAYSIPEIFDWLDREMQLAEGGAGAQPGTPVGAVLRAAFDEKYGFPRKFMRLAARNKSVFIEVTRFRLAGPGAAGDG